MKTACAVLVFLFLAGCAKQPTREDLVTQLAKLKDENAGLRLEVADLNRKYRAIRGPIMDPERPEGKDK